MTAPLEFDRNQRKNAYYRDGFRNMVWIAHIQVVLILVLSSFLMFCVTRTERLDSYFAKNIEGISVEMFSLKSPNMEKTAVTKWAVQSAAQIMSFGFNDVEERFAVSMSFFTPKGWASFKGALTGSRMFKDMHEKQLIFTSIPIKTPELLKEGLVVDRYIWKFDIWLMITYRAGKQVKTTRKKVRMIVEKVPTIDNPTGLGISEWYLY